MFIPLTQRGDSVFLSIFTHTNSWLCSSDGKAALSEDCHLSPVDRCVFPGCHQLSRDPLSGGGRGGWWWSRDHFILSWFLRYSWHNIIFASGLQHNDLLFVHNVKCYHLSPHEEHVSVSNADNLLVQEPVAKLTANRVWGVLRGKFFVVSLLFSSKEIVSVATLGNQAH